MRTGIIVFGHGSSVPSANDAVRMIAAQAAKQGGWDLYETAFLEAEPRLATAVAELAARGAEEILVLPYFLTLGLHLQRDLPRLAEEIAREHRIGIRIAPPLDGHPGLSQILVARASQSVGSKV